MANVWTSKIVTDVLKAIDVKLDKFRRNVLSDVKNTPLSPDQIPPEAGSRLSLENNEGINLRVSQIYAEVDSVANSLSSFESAVTNSLLDLQDQIDGSITTWFYDVPPSTSNPPANEWITIDDKNMHLGDLYYDTVTGYAYRWQISSGVYSWAKLSDTDVTKALADAAKAQDTADSKRRVFTQTPNPPYDVGDLWAQGSSGDLMRCKVAKATGANYASGDWENASKYTNDERAIQAESNAKTYAETKANEAKSAAEIYANTKAEAERVLAEAYADGIVNAEEQARIDAVNAALTAAANDASAKASAAEAAAISVAALDASTKAAAAQTAAEAVAVAKANLAKTEAQAYADGIVDVEEAARIAQDTATLNAAKADAEAKASAAEAAAKTYADTQLSSFATIISGDMGDLQAQIDGKITTWFFAAAPATNKEPANAWTTAADKDAHLGDLYYDTSTGRAYRWMSVSGTYSWDPITDNRITQALGAASSAQDTADSKRRVFGATPIPPYDVNDLWVQGTHGDIMRCITASTTTYNAAHWTKAVKYTDDSAVDALQTTINGAFKDGIIEQSEAQAIEKYINTVNTEKSNNDARYNIVYADANLPVAPKSDLYNKKSAYNTAHTNLINAINAAISDGKTTSVEKANVDAKFTTYKTALANLSTSFENAINAISSKKVDDLQVGGRNILRESGQWRSIPSTLYWKNNGGGLVLDENVLLGDYQTIQTTVGGGIASSDFIELDVNSIYTYSVMLRSDVLFSGTASTPLYYHCNYNITDSANSAGITVISYNQSVSVVNEWTCLYLTFKPNGKYFKPFLYFGSSKSCIFNVGYLQLEKGNKATDWTPAPEDIDAAVADSFDEVNKVIENISDIVLEPGKLESLVKTTIFEDTGYKELSNITTTTATGLTTVQSETTNINGKLNTISNWSNYEGGVLTLGTTNQENSIYKNTLSNDRWTIWEGDKEMISAIRNKVTSPRFQVTDSLIAGNTAIRVGADKHVRWLRYGR